MTSDIRWQQRFSNYRQGDAIAANISGRYLPCFQQLKTRLEAVWLFGSRAMDRHGPGSDIDLCLEGPALNHSDRLALMAAVDDLLLPWRVDLVLRQELPAELDAHVQRVGRRIWAAPIPAISGRPEP